jgi:sec-independent protein translocase protein TatC
MASPPETGTPRGPKRMPLRRRRKTPPGDPPDTSADGAGRAAAPKSDRPGAAEAEERDEQNLGSMSLREHLIELRTRLARSAVGVFAGFLVCFSFAPELYAYLTAPLEKAMPPESFMIFTGLPEGFLVEVRIAFIAGIFLASPFVFYQLWSFIAPGLYKEEKRFMLPLAFASAFFFIAGALFCYFVVFPVAFEFFMGFSTGAIRAAPSVGAYLSFATQLLLAFGLAFELPLFSFFLGRLGLLKARHLRAWRRYAILGCFILAALLTPPDVYSQLLMVVPLLILYELSVLVVAVFGKKEKRQPSAAEPAGAGQGGPDAAA